MDFTPFPKIPRLMRDIVITEKLDGTNAQVNIRPAQADFEVGYDTEVQVNGVTCYLRAGSRNRWIHPADDNFGFARWAYNNAPELAELGVGAHFGEWWGYGIGRGYGLNAHDRRFSLFNTGRWNTENVPDCCDVVPVMFRGPFSLTAIEACVNVLRHGSIAAPGFERPEGVVVFHTAGNQMFKRTLEKDVPKGGPNGS